MVVDTTPPEITCAPDERIECDAEVIFTDATATDNCDLNPVVSIVSTEVFPGPGPGEFTHTRYWEATDACGNTSAECWQSIIVEACPDEFCGFTQGFYGNEGGTFNGESTSDIINRLITGASPLVVGVEGVRSVKFENGSEACIILRLPAGGTPDSLPFGLGDVVVDPLLDCETDPPLPLDNDGGDRYLNVLLGQVIALSLNVRYDDFLGGVWLCPAMTTQMSIPGPDGDIPDPADPGRTYGIPGPVLNALSALGLDVTVNGLLELANRGLAGQDIGGVKLGHVNKAVDAINRMFDECRFLIYCGDPILSLSSLSASAPGAAKTAGLGQLPTEFSLSQNYPNPFNPNTEILFGLPQASVVRLEVFNILGRKVVTLVDRHMEAGYHTVQWDSRDTGGRAVSSGFYFYRIQADNFVDTKKMVLLK